MLSHVKRSSSTPPTMRIVEKAAGERILRWRIRMPNGMTAGTTIMPTPKAMFDHWFVKMLAGV